MRSLLAKWDAFWFAEGSVLSLGVFRFLFAVALAWEVYTSRVKNVSALDDGLFHLPYPVAIPPLPEWLYGPLHDAQYALLLLLGLGVLFRLSCGGLLAIQGYLFFVDRLNYRNHPYLFLLLLLLLMLSPADRAFSVSSVVRAVRAGRGWRSGLVGNVQPLTFQRLIQVQVCITYVFAALHKLHPAYLRGDVLLYLIEQRALSPIDLAPAVMATVATASVAIELLLPFGLWWRRTLPVCLLLGVVLHVSIAFTMNIYVFSCVMLASYLLFLEPDTLGSLFRSRRESTRLAT